METFVSWTNSRPSPSTELKINNIYRYTYVLKNATIMTFKATTETPDFMIQQNTRILYIHPLTALGSNVK